MKVKTLVAILSLALATRADNARIINFSYDSSTQRAKIQSVIPTNTTYKIEYKDNLTSTNEWRSYSYVLREGTNNTTVYSPSIQRFFRLRQR